MSSPDALGLVARIIWLLSWLFAIVCGLAAVGALTLTGYSLYHRDTELARLAALLLGAAALGLLLALAGIRVAPGA